MRSLFVTCVIALIGFWLIGAVSVVGINYLAAQDKAAQERAKGK